MRWRTTQSAAEAIAAAGLDVELSLKPTHLGLDLGIEVAEDNLRRVTRAAEAHGNWVWLDMEYSRYVDPTLELYRSILADHPKFGICLQSYLYRTRDDLESLIPLGPAVRMVKGAYAEPADVAMPVKADVDQAFFDLTVRMLAPDARRGGVSGRLATHDARLIQRIESWARPTGWKATPTRTRFSTDRRKRTETSAGAGKGVRVLIQLWRALVPLVFARPAERPANVGFVLRSFLPR